jgi:hypothetical protein
MQALRITDRPTAAGSIRRPVLARARFLRNLDAATLRLTRP